MNTKVTKKLLENVTSEEASRLFGPLGFVEAESGAFNRQRGNVVHGFGFTPNPSYTHFHVPVGVHLPSLNERLDYVAFGDAHYPTLLVSRWLGEFKETFTRHDYYYHFASIEEMRSKISKAHFDFVEQAEPWLAGLTTIEAVAKEFHKWRIAPPPGDEPRRPDPFAWAIYGWLLQEAGNEAEAIPWLERAREEVRTPRFGKEGLLVPRGTKGARLVEWNSAEIRLRELLERV